MDSGLRRSDEVGARSVSGVQPMDSGLRRNDAVVALGVSEFSQWIPPCVEASSESPPRRRTAVRGNS